MTPTWAWVTAVVIQLLIFAAAWGDLRRTVAKDREIGNERHDENRETLNEIRSDVKRINGTVARHIETLVIHGREIERLRDERNK